MPQSASNWEVGNASRWRQSIQRDWNVPRPAARNTATGELLVIDIHSLRMNAHPRFSCHRKVFYIHEEVARPGEEPPQHPCK